MSGSKYTPGPWRLVPPKRREIGHSIGISGVTNGMECMIAEAWGHNAWGISTPAEANARLIAAAPEMLEVLEEIVLQYETGILNQATIDDLVKFIINKAKGE